ncbi:1-phosphatidylinositol phosphodiesterase [Candidatus Arthromitus sp. SFB-4]|nr:1-phosphatidylinositol phosphodiesterase [Candidatus Arthromitus sp. SFB-4]
MVSFLQLPFEGTNVLTLNYIVEKDVRFTGIVVSDFPGAGLIEEIIDLNYKTNSSSNNTSGSGNNSGSSSSTTNKDGWGFTFMNS